MLFRSSLVHPLIALLGLLGVGCGCEDRLKKAPVESVERLPYPTCDGQPLPEGKLLYAGEMRAGPTMLDQAIVERYRFEDKGCVFVATMRQEWPAGTADVEAIFDKNYRPLRVWKRMTLPSRDDPGSEAEISLYELRTDPATIVQRDREGKLHHFILRGPKPTAIVGPGRGLLSAWIQKAKLKVGEKSREHVLDFRGLEKIDEVTLRRDPPRPVPALGTVDVYTAFGRESVFTSPAGWVVGDLRGMLPVDLVTSPLPPAIPLFGSPDPIGTP